MERSTPRSEAERIVTRSGAVFVLSLSGAALAMIVGFGIAFGACTNSVSQFFAGFGQTSSSEVVTPVRIPQSACPYLRIVSRAAADAAAPWHDALQSSADWNQFRVRLTGPLGELDVALEAAGPRVPGPVAQDLRIVRHDVQVGRVQLLAATSVYDYLSRSNVIEGYGQLQHAGELVANACGVALAPPFVF